MIRFIVPSSALLAVVFLALPFFVVTAIVQSAVGYFNAEVVWTGTCAPGDLSTNRSGVLSLALECDGQKIVATTNVDILLAWIESRRGPVCAKFDEPMNNEGRWECSVPESRDMDQ